MHKKIGYLPYLVFVFSFKLDSCIGRGAQQKGFGRHFSISVEIRGII